MLVTARSYLHSSGLDTILEHDGQTSSLWLLQRSALRAMRTCCSVLRNCYWRGQTSGRSIFFPVDQLSINTRLFRTTQYLCTYWAMVKRFSRS